MPHDKREESSISNFMASSWGSFSSKNKETVDIIMTILENLQGEILNGKSFFWIDSKTNERKKIVQKTEEFELYAY